MITSRCKLGRIENNEVKLLAAVSRFPKIFKDIGFNPLAFVLREAIPLSVLAGQRERLTRRVHGNHAVSPARHQGKRESARVAEAVERPHAAAVFLTELTGKALNRIAAVTLINIETGLMPDADIDPVADTVLHDLNFLRRLLTADQAGTLRKTFTLTN